MKLNVYRCDICQKEHRRADRVMITFYKNDSFNICFSDLCSVCEEKLGDEIKKLGPQEMEE
jgi:hypothetical protein